MPQGPDLHRAPKALVFGSANIDHFYAVPHFVRAGETLASASYRKLEGGKGFNQALALARAGQETCFAGACGADGVFLRDALGQAGVDVTDMRIMDVPTGHAVIQVDESGGNSILLYGGANRSITEDFISEVLARFSPGDCLLMQNEISCGGALLEAAAEKGMRVAVNPSPMKEDILSWPLGKAAWLILNEVEGEDMTGEDVPEKMLDALRARFPDTAAVLTLGSAGAWYCDRDTRLFTPAEPVRAVDTTAAGDTFTGYFLHAVLEGNLVGDAMRTAARAAAIAVTRPGAGASIPYREEVAARDA